MAVQTEQRGCNKMVVIHNRLACFVRLRKFREALALCRDCDIAYVTAISVLGARRDVPSEVAQMFLNGLYAERTGASSEPVERTKLTLRPEGGVKHNFGWDTLSS